MISVTNRSHQMPTTQWTVSNDGWNTMEENALYNMYSSMAKGTSQTEVTLNNEKIKLVALDIEC